MIVCDMSFREGQVIEEVARLLRLSPRTLQRLLNGEGISYSDLVDRCRETLSFGPPTLAHALARLVLLEQLYRCCTIIRNEPYHH